VHDDDLQADEMQRIAHEIHFSESTFVRDGTCDVRIFTPDMEVPFAGHPTLGTAFVIRELLGWTRSNRVVLNLGVGAIPVDFADGLLTMEQKPPSFGNVIADRTRLARILGIDDAGIDARFPPQVVSTGLPSVIVPLTSLAAARRCAIRHDLYAQFLGDTEKAALLVFTTEAESADLHVRVFVDDAGFFEDPATGSANGNLAGWLLEHRYFEREAIRYVVEQGVEMGRPSRLYVDAQKRDGRFTIRVGGRVYAVAEGDWAT
jgi:trans-2,3-dihydro-3-hydroxyanthranilate isomerase